MRLFHRACSVICVTGRFTMGRGTFRGLPEQFREALHIRFKNAINFLSNILKCYRNAEKRSAGASVAQRSTGVDGVLRDRCADGRVDR
jgi:hypothetical protein